MAVDLGCLRLPSLVQQLLWEQSPISSGPLSNCFSRAEYRSTTSSANGMPTSLAGKNLKWRVRADVKFSRSTVDRYRDMARTVNAQFPVGADEAHCRSTMTSLTCEGVSQQFEVVAKTLPEQRGAQR